MVCCEGCIHCTHLSSFTHPHTSSRWCDSLLWKREPLGWFLTAPLQTHWTHNIRLLPTDEENIRQQEPSETLISVITISSHEASTLLDFHLCFLQMLWLCWWPPAHTGALAAESEATETRISTSKSEATVLSKKRAECPFREGVTAPTGGA